jgi:hypothetical protein
MHLEKSDKRTSRMHEVVNEVFFRFLGSLLGIGYFLLKGKGTVRVISDIHSHFLSHFRLSAFRWPSRNI